MQPEEEFVHGVKFRQIHQRIPDIAGPRRQEIFVIMMALVLRVGRMVQKKGPVIVKPIV